MNLQTPINPAVMTEREAAIYLAISMPSLKLWRRQGRGPQFVLFGPASVRYRRIDLDQWLSDQTSYRITADAHKKVE